MLLKVPFTPGRRPTVSVVVPAYNYARYLTECAQSVLGQRDVDVSLIIVDDCSTDETPRVTAELAADPRVTVLRNDPNLGHIPSVNRGLERVDGDFTVKLDADDLLAPGALARATALLDAQPGVSFVYGRPRHFTGAVPRQIDLPPLSWTVWPGSDWLARLCRTGVNAISQPEVVIRTASLRGALPIRTDLPHTSDMHLWMQLASIGDVARINGPAQGYYREHDASMQRTVNSGTAFDLRARRAAFDAAFAGVAGTLPRARELRDLASRTIAGNALDRACRAYDRGRTDEAPIDEYITLALETWPDARDLPEWEALDRRRAVGSRRAARDPRFMTAALVRRAIEETSRIRWRHTGEVGPQRWQQVGVR
ncbi:MAG: glycosyltransferase family A protein [Solirubrobacteraceae bacterium]